MINNQLFTVIFLVIIRYVTLNSVLAHLPKKSIETKGTNSIFEIVNTTYSCPNDFILNESSCLKNITTSPQPFCTNGYLSNQGDCIVKQRPVMQCEDGYVNYNSYSFHGKSSTCIKSEYRNANVTCNDGSSPIGTRCLVNITKPAELVCPNKPRNHNYHGIAHGKYHYSYPYDNQNDCFDIDQTNASMSCPSNLVLINDVCTGTALQPCYDGTKSKAFYGSKQYSGKSFGDKKNTGKYRKLGLKYESNKKNYEPSFCNRTINQSPIYTCPDGYTENKVMWSSGKVNGKYSILPDNYPYCYKKTPVDLIPICTQGTLSPDNTTCIIEDYEPAVYSCDPPFQFCTSAKAYKLGHGNFGLDNDICCNISWRSQDSICFLPFTIDMQGMCSATFPAETSCPYGFIADNNTCFKTEIIPAQANYTWKETKTNAYDKYKEKKYSHSHGGHKLVDSHHNSHHTSYNYMNKVTPLQKSGYMVHGQHPGFSKYK